MTVARTPTGSLMDEAGPLPSYLQRPGRVMPTPSPLLYSALDIALQCTYVKLPETILIAAIDELKEYRNKIAAYETDERENTMTILLIIAGAIIIFLILVIAGLVYLYQKAIFESRLP
jgi:hypothetical protein